MHDYSIDTSFRKKVHVSIAVIALSAPAFFQSVRNFLGLPVNWGFPLTFGSLFGIMYYIFDKWFWKLMPNIPDLNGKWISKGVSSFKDPETGENFSFTMEIKIKQTSSKMEVFTETETSTSRSTMASICTQHAVPIFRYAFENTPKNMANAELQRHPGMVELRIESKNCLKGDYFSGKHRLRFGELTLERK